MFIGINSNLFWISLVNIVFSIMMAFRLLPGVLKPERLSSHHKVFTFLAFVLTPVLMAWSISPERLFILPVVWGLAYIASIPSVNIGTLNTLSLNKPMYMASVSLGITFVIIAACHSFKWDVVIWACNSLIVSGSIFWQENPKGMRPAKCIAQIVSMAYGIFAFPFLMPLEYIRSKIMLKLT